MMKMIDKEEILDKTNRGLDVFKHYIGFQIKPGRKFRNPLYEDKNASCNIYFDRHSQVFKMKDFGNDVYSGDCFWFYAKLKSLDVKRDFLAVVSGIVSDMHINISEQVRVKTDFNGPSKKLEPRKNVATQPPKRDCNIETKPFSASECQFWQQYGISKEILEKYSVRSVTMFEGRNRSNESYRIMSTPTEPMFAYIGNGYAKIYRPCSKMRFLYGGEMPEIYCFGLEQLPNKGDLVFITGGEKDVMSLASHGFNAVCFNSETAAIPERLIQILVLKFRHVIILYDMDETGIRESARQVETLSEYHLVRMELPLSGEHGDKDISDYFASGKSGADFKKLVAALLEKVHSKTLMMLKSCEMDYNNPPEISKTVVSVNGVPLGTYDNLLCVTGGEGTGKSNFVSALVAGTLTDTATRDIDTLGFDICPNYSHKAVLHYDTEQSEFQLFKNMGKTMKRAGNTIPPQFYHTFYLASMSRKERIAMIRDSMDLYHHRHGGIHLIVIDGVADLIRSANDEAESIAIVDELYRLAGIYRTSIICVLHFVPNGIKLRGHIGSELQRKAAAILSIEQDDNPACSVVKAIKVRDGSPLDVPMLLFTWDKQKEMHIFAGEKSPEEKERRKQNELASIVKDIFRNRSSISYTDLVNEIMTAMEIKERTAKSYIRYMKENDMLKQDKNNNYTN